MQIKLLYLWLLTYWYNLSFGFILMGFITALAISTRILRKKKIVFLKKDICFILLFIASLFSVKNNPIEHVMILKIILYPSLITFAIQNIPFNKGQIYTSVHLLIFISFVLVFLMFFQEEPGKFVISFDSILSKSRSSGFYFIDEEMRVGPNTISSLEAFSIALIFSLMMSNRKYIFIYLLPLIIMIVLLVISSGRASWLAVVMTVVYLIYRQEKRLVLGGFIGLFICILLIILLPLLQKYQSVDFFQRIELMFFPMYDASFYKRYSYLIMSLMEIKGNVFGFGYTHFINKYGITTHNEWTAQLMGAGILGLILFIGIFIFYIISFINKQGNDTFYSSIFYSILIIFGIISLFENISYTSNNIFWPLVWFTFSLAHKASANKSVPVKRLSIQYENKIH